MLNFRDYFFVAIFCNIGVYTSCNNLMLFSFISVPVLILF